MNSPAKRRWVSFVAQTPGYFQQIHLPLMQGRDFNETDGTENHEAAVLTQDAANRLWPGENPMGKRFRLFDDKGKATNWVTVVGISADMVQELQDSDPPPLLFVPYRMEGWRGEALVVAADGDPLPSIRRWFRHRSRVPVNTPSRLKGAIEHQMWFLSLFGKIFLTFALVAMLMASVGLYAIIAHSTGSRTQEIGVRIAMGATMRNILLLIMKRGIWQISIGLGLGLLAAIPVVKTIAALPIKGQHSDPWS